MGYEDYATYPASVLDGGPALPSPGSEGRGWKQKDIAEALDVTTGAVSQWLKAAKAQGEEALRSHRAPGPQPKLTDQQKAEIPKLLSMGAEAYGCIGEVWTTAPHSQDDQGGLRCQLPTGSRQSAPQVDRLERPEADSTSYPTGRGSHRAVVHRAVARD